MAKQGEIDYLRNIGEAGVQFAVRKPFSDDACSRYLMEIGAVLALLPPPPRRLLDVGCGTGWTSLFFARRGYEVVGVDICSDMIEQANLLRDREALANLQFQVSDYEGMHYHEEFDCAVFYDSLHHAVDEELALRKVYAALKPGGICVTSEPGVGHAEAPGSVHAREAYGVTEKDMPPFHIRKLAQKIGYRRSKVYPHAFDLEDRTYHTANGPGWSLLRKVSLLGKFRNALALVKLLLVGCHRSGIVVLRK